MKMSAKAILLAIPLLGSACASSSASFVEERTAYSVTKGRLLAIEGLTSQKITNLSDGVAMQITAGECRVTIGFGDDSQRTIQLQSPSMVVCGTDSHYVLQPIQDARPGAEPAK